MEPVDTGSDKRHAELDRVFVYGTLKSSGSVRGMMSLVTDETDAEIIGLSLIHI